MSARMTGRNEYRCHFCHKPCRKGGKATEYSKHAGWHSCLNCSSTCIKRPVTIHYAVGPCSKIKGIHFSIPDKDDKRSSYNMEINYKKKQTKIFRKELYENAMQGRPSAFLYIFPPPHYVNKDILTLDKCINDVTPDNALDKINMYILFS